MKKTVRILAFLLCIIAANKAVSQNNFVGTWEGLGSEQGDKVEYTYISKMLVDQQPKNDTLYFKLYLQALNGNKVRDFVAFKALLIENSVHVLNNTIKPRGDHKGDKKFILVTEDKQPILNGIFKTPDRPSLYLKLAKTSNTKEKTVDENQLNQCLATNGEKTLNPTIDEMGLISASCIVAQLDLKNARYTYDEETNILAIKIAGLMPINLVIDKGMAGNFLKNKAKTMLQLKAIEEVRFTNLAFSYETYDMIKGIDMLAPLIASVSNPGLKHSINYPQLELENISLKPMFRKLISKNEARKP